MAPSAVSSPTNSSCNLQLTRLKLDRAAMNSHSAMMIKFTDESIMAIKKAQKARKPIVIKIDSQGGFIQVSSGEQSSKYRFVIQQVPGAPSDALLFDRDGRHRTVATFQSKIQVHSTEKALAGTREKAQKFIEEENKKKLKESSRQKHDQHNVVVKRATKLVAIGAQRPSSTTSVRSHHHSESSRTSKTAPSNGFSSSTNSSAAGARSLVLAELSRRPVRKRIVHLVVLARFSSVDEIIAQYKKDSLTEESAAEDIPRIRDIVDEIAETNKVSGRLQLKQVYFNEVDARWPVFSSEEKGYVRKILSGNMSNITNFAPTRKSGIAPMLAPASGALTSTISVNSADVPDYTCLAEKVKVAENMKLSTPADNRLGGGPCTNFAAEKDLKTNVVPSDNSPAEISTSKRKAHKPNVSVSAKRPRQQSLSPPEDPSNANIAIQPKTTPRLHSDGDRIREPVSASVSPTAVLKPSRDWLKEFADPRNLVEAEKYYNRFLEDYPLYIKCYNQLSAVAGEFAELEKQLKETEKNVLEHEKVEKCVKKKYMHYQRDAEFIEARQVHTDLRAKLEVLKMRIIAWENKGKLRDQETGNVQREQNEHSDIR